MTTERIATLAILGIVLVVVLFVVIGNSITGKMITGDVAKNAYSGSKLYGGAIKKVQSTGYSVDSWEAARIAQWQALMLDNPDELDCSFGLEALSAPYPCMFDEEKGKYCCLTSAAV